VEASKPKMAPLETLPVATRLLSTYDCQDMLNERWRVGEGRRLMKRKEEMRADGLAAKGTLL